MEHYMLIFSLLPCLVMALPPRNVSVSWDSVKGDFIIHDSVVNNWVAWATFTNEINTTGWSYLEVHTNDDYKDSYQAYAAGLAEGYITSDLIKKHWNNMYADYCDGEKAYCDRLKEFLQANLDFLNSQIEKSQSRKTNSYWHQIALILEQVKGLEDGYKNKPSVPSTKPSIFGPMFFNLFGDLMDLEDVLNKTTKKRVLGSGHCSGLIKLLPGNTDLYVAQDSWNTYNSMLRILKKYVIPVRSSTSTASNTVPGHTVSFSSYPATIFSGDDFYVLSSRLVAIETTIGNSNSSLWKYVVPNKIVFEWMRNIVANRLADKGEGWTYLFSLYNSGTYNNQWMIVDYNRFFPGKPPRRGALWVLEQLPGHIERKDQTNHLLNHTYWPSYNSPYYPDIFNISGTLNMVKKYGDWFTYDKTPRALIFKRDHKKVHDLTSMTKLMRYNDYKNDILSRCNCTPPYSAENAIAARSDLNPPNGTYPFPSLGHRAHGAIDMKLTSYFMHMKYQFVAYGGPTYDQQPPFQWSKSDFVNEQHEGQPDLWQFRPVVHQWINDN
uniref:Phospholipase B-like n=1 Tax=Hadrurus spadix TaxID=141984 RepID=A0A1W7R9X8_9SCOR